MEKDPKEAQACDEPKEKEPLTQSGTQGSCGCGCVPPIESR